MEAALNYQQVRDVTSKVCAALEYEDHVVQPHWFISPPKWHLGHTTWFFETFCTGGDPYNPFFPYIFNSYYETIGTPHVPQGERGALSRPTVREVNEYREHVDHKIGLLEVGAEIEWKRKLEVGLHHEQQHQELLFMDIKHILFHQPGRPAYRGPAPIAPRPQTTPAHEWTEFSVGLYETGAMDDGFAFDNERPRHHIFLEKFSISTDLVTNAEFGEFVKDGGYKRPELWLSDGWAWVQKQNIKAPLYWLEDARVFTLEGETDLHPQAPVAHVSYYEADAYARWQGARLPTEAEFETAFPGDSPQPLWQWTNSAYMSYPGYRPFAGALAEYNGKFMAGQMVLRGGCFATPEGHYRHTYRNFFYPEMRWQFSGIRLAK